MHIHMCVKDKERQHMLFMFHIIKYDMVNGIVYRARLLCISISAADFLLAMNKI